MMSDYVMTQLHCEGLEVAVDPVGLAAYGMDSHHVQRYITQAGFVSNERNLHAKVAETYPISYRSIIPKLEECVNLLVLVCLTQIRQWNLLLLPLSAENQIVLLTYLNSP